MREALKESHNQLEMVLKKRKRLLYLTILIGLTSHSLLKMFYNVKECSFVKFQYILRQKS